jgi:L-2-hydroxycarboxylate dehydrogenase (NAD+)
MGQVSGEAETLQRFDVGHLTRFVTAVFIAVGVRPADAAIAAAIVITSDLRGIDSHGLPRVRFYVDFFKAGVIDVKATPTIERETASTAAIDAHNGFGPPAAHWAMERCLEKAEATGLAFVTVRNSNHFGIAGYYATMGLPRGLAALAMTNATPLVVPTYGREAMLGTNPLAFAVPAGSEPPFILDMATSAVAWGKVEIARRADAALPAGWALDTAGQPTADPQTAVALQPLGGAHETGGHKGYGLSALVDILCGPLAGAAFGVHIAGSRTRPRRPAGIGHFFAAWRPDAFRPIAEFRDDLDIFLAELRATAPLPGHERVYVPGDLERLAEADRRQHGIPLHHRVIADLEAVAAETGVPFDAAIR